MSEFHKAIRNRPQTQTQVDRQKEQLGQQAAIAAALSMIPISAIIPLAAGATSSQAGAYSTDYFLPADGAEHPISEFPELYAAIGNTYDIVGVTTTPGFFKVPDMTEVAYFDLTLTQLPLAFTYIIRAR